MKKGNLKPVSAVLSMLLAFILVAETAVIPDGFSKLTKAKAADALSGVQLGVPVMSADGNRFTFGNAEIAGNKTYTIMSIAVDKGCIYNNDTYPWSMTDLGAHKTATWQWETPKTTEEIQTIVRSIEFQHVQGVKVDITIDSGESELPSGGIITSYKMYNDDMTQYKMHYYMYVPNSGSGGYHNWEDAYHLAKTYTYLGLTGYLVTITEEGEDRVLDNITGNGVQAWAGGVRVRYDESTGKIVANDSLDTEYFNEASQAPESYAGGSITDSAWVWACGPEAGIFIPNSVSGGYQSTDSKTGVNSKVLSNPMLGTYSNWKQNEPNNYSPHEWCLLVHFGSPAQVTNDGWNDYPHDATSIVGFFVEFGGYDDDPWMDAETGLVVGQDDGATSQSTSVQLNEEWDLSSNKNVFYAKCNIVITSLIDGSKTVYPTDVTRTFTFNAGSRYYTGFAYNYTNFISAAERQEFLDKTGFSASDFPATVSVQYYMDEECTIPTDNANSGALGSGKAPCEIGKYYAATTIKGVRVVDDFEILPNPSADADKYSDYEPSEDPVPALSHLTGYQRESDGAIVVKGFWSETDPGKMLVLSIGGTLAINIDMSGVCGKNFSIVLPGETVNEVTYVDAYHQDNYADKIRINTALNPVCTTVAPDYATVTWGAVQDIAGYSVEVAYDENFNNLVEGYAPKTVASANSLKITGLNPETAYYFRLRTIDEYARYGAYSRTICFTTLEAGADPEAGNQMEVHGDRAPYTIGEDGSLPVGLLYGQIDYDIDFIEDTIIYAKDENGNAVYSSYINLTTEKLVTDLDYDYYSINNGKTWTKAKTKIDDKKLQSLLKKGFTLKLLKGAVVKKKITEGSVVLSFDKIAARQKVSTLKVNYAIYSDPSGLTNGQWTTTIEGAETNVTKYWFGITDESGKNLGSEGWGLWPYMDGVWVKDTVGGKQIKEKYLIKIPAYGNKPASLTKKITVCGVAKASKSKVNYTYETLSVAKDFMAYYGEEIPDTRKDKGKLIRKSDEAPFECIDLATAENSTGKLFADYSGKAFKQTEKPVKLSLSAYITDERNTIIVWKQATASKPASEKLVIKLAARGPVANEDTDFTVKSGSVKLKISKTLSYTYYDASKGKWKSTIPKLNTNAMFKVRSKVTAKGGKESDTTYATGYESYLVLEYGVYNEKTGKKGYVSAKAFETEEEATAYLEELNAAAAVTPTPEPSGTPAP